ncbi:MAG: 50S ribosomal protein L21 [Candidatus Marinimicrobia bacterium]|nr:50S ribosomal protein L21 [Candidatus Neomarinimicrobiota bacterium]
MYAIVEISGKQFKVNETDTVKVPVQNADVNAKLEFPNVMLLDKDGDVTVGNPFVKDAAVKAHVLENGRDKKIIVFKKKRRKDYKVKRGHRQGYTLLKVDSISVSKPKTAKTGTAKAGTEKTGTEKAKTAKTASAKKPAAAKKTSASGKATAKKGETTKKAEKE